MNSTRHRLLLLLSVAIAFVSTGIAQAPTSATKATAAISGRVTIDGQPAPGVEVMLRPSGNPMIDLGIGLPPPPVASTDADGRYKFPNVAAGAYRVTAYAPVYVIQGESRGQFEIGRALNLAENENVENVDFTMTRGGAVTGKVTDEYGRAVIAEAVNAFRLDQDGKRTNTAPLLPPARIETDDRGVYRIFGLEAGRYMVAAGSSSEDINFRMGAGSFYKRTYHPDTTDESKAAVLEIKPGGEVDNIDIRIARATKGYSASGRVVEAETGRPVPGVLIGYGVVKKTAAGFTMGDSATNSAGEFRLEGLSPNSYRTFVINVGASDLYPNELNFEIAGGDVTGLEIKMSQGASISGVAVVEGTRDPAILAGLSKIQLQALGDSKEMMMNMGSGSGTINANGTFRIGGVRPGKTRMMANTFMAPKGLSLTRIEHNSSEVKQFDISPGDKVTGVRLVFTYGTGVIAGRLEIIGGTLQPNQRLNVTATREGDSPDDYMSAKRAPVDGRNQFLIEGLSPGSYKLRLSAMVVVAEGSVKSAKTEKIVTISDNPRQEVTLELDPAKKEEDK